MTWKPRILNVFKVKQRKEHLPSPDLIDLSFEKTNDQNVDECSLFSNLIFSVYLDVTINYF